MLFVFLLKSTMFFRTAVHTSHTFDEAAMQKGKKSKHPLGRHNLSYLFKFFLMIFEYTTSSLCSSFPFSSLPGQVDWLKPQPFILHVPRKLQPCFAFLVSLPVVQDNSHHLLHLCVLMFSTNEDIHSLKAILPVSPFCSAARNTALRRRENQCS